MNTKLKNYVAYTKSVPVFVSVNLFFSVCKHHGYSRNAFCDKKIAYEEYTERISTRCLNIEKNKLTETETGTDFL